MQESCASGRTWELMCRIPCLLFEKVILDRDICSIFPASFPKTIIIDRNISLTFPAHFPSACVLDRNFFLFFPASFTKAAIWGRNNISFSPAYFPKIVILGRNIPLFPPAHFAKTAIIGRASDISVEDTEQCGIIPYSAQKRNCGSRIPRGSPRSHFSSMNMPVSLGTLNLLIKSSHLHRNSKKACHPRPYMDS